MKKKEQLNINYIDYGDSEKDPVVLLHGWGQNIQMMKPVGDFLSRNNRVIIIDLPGFGESPEPDSIWTLYDYAKAINELLTGINVNNPILIGHSFGGKISLLYASIYGCKKLILLGSPFKKEIQKLSLKTKILKSLKKVPMLNKLEETAKKYVGSKDYRDASPVMRKILVEHVNLDITEEIKKVKCPTLIIWGTNDAAVPLERAYELEKLIDDSAVIEYEGCTHYAYLERLGQTNSIISKFIWED